MYTHSCAALAMGYHPSPIIMGESENSIFSNSFTLEEGESFTHDNGWWIVAHCKRRAAVGKNKKNICTLEEGAGKNVVIQNSLPRGKNPLS